MSNKKISALSSATTPLTGSEIVPINQSSVTDSVSVANLTAGRSVSASDYVMSTGNLVPGTAAKGINFTANTPAAGKTSQLLNWYEEGTWTPTDASGVGLSLTIGSATYVRTGRMVTCFAWITYPATGTTAAAQIGGIPFIHLNTNNGMGVTCYNSANFQMFARANTSTAFVFVNVTNTSILNANLSGALLGLQYTFFV